MNSVAPSLFLYISILMAPVLAGAIINPFEMLQLFQHACVSLNMFKNLSPELNLIQANYLNTFSYLLNFFLIRTMATITANAITAAISQ